MKLFTLSDCFSFSAKNYMIAHMIALLHAYREKINSPNKRGLLNSRLNISIEGKLKQRSYLYTSLEPIERSVTINDYGKLFPSLCSEVFD